jgi:hypothetical protein
VVNSVEQQAVLLHIAASPDPAKLVVGRGTSVQDASGNTVRFRAIQPGDLIDAAAVPTPDKALVYLASRLSDLDLQALHDQLGLVDSWNPRTHLLTVHFLDGSWRTVAVNRQNYRGPLDDRGNPRIQASEAVSLTGAVNTRLHRLVDVVTVQVYQPT